uniref:RING-type domain-containing protein n=1 Tax=Clytia hemisphaerica TaxID=252671 RepID=A0A7M6DRN5_9CNID
VSFEKEMSQTIFQPVQATPEPEVIEVSSEEDVLSPETSESDDQEEDLTFLGSDSTQTNDQVTECCICMRSIKSHSKVFAMKCGHMAGGKCLSQWFEQDKRCPVCRNIVEAKDVIRLYPA